LTKTNNETTHLSRVTKKRNGVPHLDGTQRTAQTAQRKDANGATKRRNETAQTAQRNGANGATKQRKQRNETVFAPPLQRHEHNRYDCNERHEQRRQPLN